MLVRIEKLQGIGLFHDTWPGKHEFRRVTLLYGDNGLGKSTLAGILRSVAAHDSKTVEEMRTFKGDKDPHAILQFNKGEKVEKVKYSEGAWSEARPEVVVFDQNFIETNVYSGADFRVEHQRSLLRFALGEAAVIAKSEADTSADRANRATTSITGIKKGLAGYHVGILLEDFQKLPLIDKGELETKLAYQEQLKVSAEKNSSLSKQQRPKVIPVPDFVFKPLTDIFNHSLERTHDAAKDAVNTINSHAEVLGHGDETWLSEGTTLLADNDKCPYCGQGISNIDLIQAYRLHFDAKFHAHQDDVKRLPDLVERLAGKDLTDSIIQSLDLQIEREQFWSNELELQSTTAKTETLRSLFSELQSELTAVVKRKIADPTTTISIEALDAAKGVVKKIQAHLALVNDSLAKSQSAIDDFISVLDHTDAESITTEIKRLQSIRTRHYSADATRELSRLEAAKKELIDANEEKDRKRAELNTLMDETLTKYQTQIDSWLKILDASFTIKVSRKFDRSGEPKAEYHLNIRGDELGKQHSFAATLSEGEKRTLAFAFFLAKIFDDPEQLARSIIVLDDPMTSFDQNRNRKTINSIRRLSDEAGQLIVLAHNRHFLWDVEKDIKKDIKRHNPDNHIQKLASFEIHREGKKYSGLKTLDLKQKCEDKYQQSHRVISEFISTGEGAADAVAGAIRRMLEGYLIRRFPGENLAGKALGTMINEIKTATDNPALGYAKNQINELNDMLTYANDPHHDDGASNDISKVELTDYCNRALNLVHGWNKPPEENLSSA